MQYFGVDFSINSPALCHYNGESYNFYSFFNIGDRDPSKPLPKGMSMYAQIQEVGVEAIPYSRSKTDADYVQDQFNKIKDSTTVARLINSKIQEIKMPGIPCTIGIEGYSYGSKGNSFIDLIQFNAVLRSEIYRSLSEEDCIKVLSPSMIKKEAGKGNANKLQMLEFFLAQDNLVQGRSDFFDWCKDNPNVLLNQKGDIQKPIDDLVDSYFIVRTLRALDTLPN
jgi:hypothetical protein